MAHFYLIHGFVLQLPFACGELEVAPAGAIADVLGCAGQVALRLEASLLRDPQYDCTVDRFLYRGGPRSARFLVEEGRRITFERNPGCEMSLFLHHLLHPVMAALLRQRRLLVFHASAAVGRDGAVLVAGASGAGKSTTVAHLVAMGLTFLADDLTALRWATGRVVEALPGAHTIHLHEDAAVALPFDTSALPRHDWHRKKLALRAPCLTRAPAPLRRIAWLAHAPQEAITVTRIAGRAKLHLLLHAVYGPWLAEQAGHSHDLMVQALAQVEVIAIGRPLGAWTLEAVARAVTDG